MPKDTKQFLANYQDVPNDLISAIVKTNSTRMDFIADCILKRQPKFVGIYRLIMKSRAGNFRSSSIQGFRKLIKSKGIQFSIFEPLLKDAEFSQSFVINYLGKFKQQVDVIVANRITDDLQDVEYKLFSSDLFGIN